jgi:shikimate dehydrogenase
VARDADIVINATSLGLRDDDALPLDLGLLRAGCLVLDLVYSPEETRLVREARAAGFRTVDGKGMLMAQGTLAFAWWFDVQPDVGVMWDALTGVRPPVP